jgi:hypothetical protein
MADIVEDLKSWHAQLVKDAPHRVGQLPEIDIALVRRAIEEIERLRAEKKS